MILETQQVTKVYYRGEQKIEALRGVSISLKRGQFTSIMGPSGSGKSTLLHVIGGLDRPSSGKVILENQAIENYSDRELAVLRRRRFGFIFQFFNLLPTLSAVENVCLPLLLDGQSYGKVASQAKTLLEKIGMSHRMDHYPDQLSGGEMQRVAIARALISDPVLILADEPTGNLDSKTGTKVLELLASLAREKGHSILMVTHDPKAAAFGDRMITVKDGLIESDRAIKPGQHLVSEVAGENSHA